MKPFVSTSILAVLLASGDCSSGARTRAQVCGSDSDCGRMICELGRCVATAAASVIAPPYEARVDGRSSFSAASTTPHETFRVELRDRILASPRLRPSGDVLVVTEAGHLVVIDARGTCIAEATLGRRVVATPVVDIAGRVFIGAADGHVVILDSSLAPLHQLELGDAILGPLTLLPNGLVAVPTRGVALVTASGVVVRRIASPSVLRGGAAYHPRGLLVFGTPEGHLVGARLDGSLAFDASVGASIDGSPAIARDGSIVFGNDLGELVRASAEGAVLGRFTADGDIRATPVVTNDSVLAVSLDGVVHGLDLALARRFATPLYGELLAPPLVDRDGHIFVGSTLGRLHVLAPDGHALAMVSIGADVITTPVLTPDGTIVVAADDGTVRGHR